MLKNFCGRGFNVTLDVAYQPDSKCTKRRSGKTGTLRVPFSLTT
jgi:hypothetical protein